MTIRKKYNKGDLVGGIKFIKELPKIDKSRYALWECPVCKGDMPARIPTIESGRQVSCGCFRHGEYATRPYKRWQAMISRCLYKKNISYKNYGGRGIKVYDKWLHDYLGWKNYVLSLPNAFKTGYTIDRIDNDGDYEPGNLRWVDYRTQIFNRRKIKISKSGYAGVGRGGRAKSWTSYITVKGERLRLGAYQTPEVAAKVRDQYIIDNELWEYPLQIIKTNHEKAKYLSYSSLNSNS